MLLVEIRFQPQRRAIYLRIAAGGLLALSVLSKQSAGVVLAPVPLGVALFAGLPHRRMVAAVLLQVAAGVLLVSAIFAIWLWTVSSVAGFYDSVIVMSRVMATSRADRITSVPDLLQLVHTRSVVRVALIAFVVFALSPGAFAKPNSAEISWILLGYIFLQKPVRVDHV